MRVILNLLLYAVIISIPCFGLGPAAVGPLKMGDRPKCAMQMRVGSLVDGMGLNIWNADGLIV